LFTDQYLAKNRNVVKRWAARLKNVDEAEEPEGEEA
jgi:hypothetical protein